MVKKVSIFLGSFYKVGAPPSQRGGILAGVPALHGNQHSDLGGEQVLETSNENARFLTPRGRKSRPPGIKYILNVLYLLSFVFP